MMFCVPLRKDSLPSFHRSRWAPGTPVYLLLAHEYGHSTGDLHHTMNTGGRVGPPIERTAITVSGLEHVRTLADTDPSESLLACRFCMSF